MTSSKPHPVPETYRRVTPCLIIDGAAKALEFYAEVFGLGAVFVAVTTAANEGVPADTAARSSPPRSPCSSPRPSPCAPPADAPGQEGAEHRP